MHKTKLLWRAFIIFEEMFALEILSAVSKMIHGSSDGVFICFYYILYDISNIVYIRELYLCFS